MIATGSDLISYLKEKSKEKGKFFFARPQDGENAQGVVGYYEDNYTLEMLEQAINLYLDKERDLAVTVGTFVQKMGDINMKIVADKQADDRFKKLLEHTKQIMEDLG